MDKTKMNAAKVTSFTPPSTGGEEPPVSAAVCENIGPRERQMRARFGWLALGFALALAAVLLLTGAGVWWRLLLFFPVAVAVTNWLQVRERTCVKYASRGTRNLDQGEESIEDQGLRDQLRRKALWITIRAGLIGAVLTAVVVALP